MLMQSHVTALCCVFGVVSSVSVDKNDLSSAANTCPQADQANLFIGTGVSLFVIKS